MLKLPIRKLTLKSAMFRTHAMGVRIATNIKAITILFDFTWNT
jgi:hypothetical protein